MTIHKRTAVSRGTMRFAATLVMGALAIGGCTDFAGYDLDYIMGRASVLSTMRNTVSFEPQDLALTSPVGSVPVAGPGADAPSPFTQLQLDSAAATLSNPLPASESVLARGAFVYNNQCAVCHGAQGAGNGSVIGAGRFPTPPSLAAGAAAGRSDGYLYAIIRVGRGLMPAYGDRIDHEDRWAVVHYVRQLQGASAPAAPATAAAAATGGQAGIAPAAGAAAQPGPGQAATPAPPQ